MKIIDFVKKNYEIFVVNFIVLGFIAIILLAQFGVHIKVDKGVDLVPVKLGSTTERYVYLEYENNKQMSFWMPVSVVFGRTGEDEIIDMIKDGVSIKRNVFFNTKSNKVIGVTKSGKSPLSLYYHNSKLFRYGIWILIIVDVFVGFLIKSRNTKSQKTIDISQYRYYPEDKRTLELNEILFWMRDFRVLYIAFIPVWAIWGIFVFSFFYVGVIVAEGAVGIIIKLILLTIPLGVIILIRRIAKSKDEKKRLIKNAHKYLSNVGEDFLEQLQADLNKGLPFMKKYNLVISDNYIIGSMADIVFNPMAIPKEQIGEIAYVYYEIVTIKRHYVVQEVYFRLKNGKEIRMSVGDRNNLGLTLRALKDCGVPITDITQKKRFGR